MTQAHAKHGKHFLFTWRAAARRTRDVCLPRGGREDALIMSDGRSALDGDNEGRNSSRISPSPSLPF